MTAAFGTAAALGGATRASARAASSATGIPGDPSSVDPIRWLVEHATLGFTIAEYAQAKSMGYEDWLESQLDPATIDDSAADARLAAFPTISMTAAEIYDNYVVHGNNFQAARELRSAAIVRAVYSRRQLFERVVEFWTDHFNIEQMNFQDRWLKTVDDRDVIRKNAFGQFSKLLRGSAHSAAMLYYLNNDQNVQLAPNENYARELLELHSVGVDGGYDEDDVKEVARALTGWTFYPKGHPQHGEFLFDAAVHDYGPKSVMDLNLPPGGGEADGGIIVNYLAGHPSTAQFVARKLTAWLLMYDPPQNVVDRVAQTFLSSGGDVREMVREILSIDTFYEVQAWQHRKLKRPFHFAMGMLRASLVDVQAADTFVDELEFVGHAPYAWPQPNGLPDTEEHWSGGMLPRWILASKYFEGNVEGMVFSLNNLFLQVGGFDRAHAGEQLNAIFAGGGLSSNDVAQLQAFFDSHASVTTAVLREGLALAVSSPSYQYY